MSVFAVSISHTGVGVFTVVATGIVDDTLGENVQPCCSGSPFISADIYKRDARRHYERKTRIGGSLSTSAKYAIRR